MTDFSASNLVTVDDLRAMLATHAPVTVLDVRAAADRAEWAIPGSIHIDAYDALKAGDPRALAAVAPPPEAPVVTVCGAGKVSLTAMAQLRARGYDARSLIGGMKAWSLAWNTASVPLPNSEATVIQARRTGKGCLSYLIGDEGEAVVVDPALPPPVYQRLAAGRGWTIAHVLDTHVHADHLSRARQLAAATGATLHLPAQDRVRSPFQPVNDGDALRVGRAQLVARRTPGHTLESTSYVLDGVAVFSGDTLFLSGVGRPDLDASPEEARTRARLLHRSLRTLLAFPPPTLILPGHMSAPAAFDGQPIAATLGQVIDRVAMLALPEESFVDAILARIPPTPPNHATIVGMNERGETPDDDPTDLEAGANRCAVS